MTEQELDSIYKNLIKIAKSLKAEMSYLDNLISICQELKDCEKDFDAETVLIYLKGIKIKNQDIFDSARNFYNLCVSLKGEVDDNMEKVIGKASRILSGKIKTYKQDKEKLLNDLYFQKYVESKLQTNNRNANEKTEQTNCVYSANTIANDESETIQQ